MVVAYFDAFRTSMSIIFDEEYSIAFLLFIMYSRRCSMIAKNGKSALKILKIHRGRHFFYYKCIKDNK